MLLVGVNSLVQNTAPSLNSGPAQISCDEIYDSETSAVMLAIIPVLNNQNRQRALSILSFELASITVKEVLAKVDYYNMHVTRNGEN